MLKLDNMTLTHLIAKGMVKEFRWRAAAFFCGALRTAIAAFTHRMGPDWCKSLPQPAKWISLTPHEASELAKLQAKLYVRVR